MVTGCGEQHLQRGWLGLLSHFDKKMSVCGEATGGAVLIRQEMVNLPIIVQSGAVGDADACLGVGIKMLM